MTSADPVNDTNPARGCEARMPVMFVGHGSPMNAIDDNEFSRSWQSLGEQFGPGKRWPLPKLILCVSAHWLTHGWWITAMDQPPTIHDFGGFPQALFAQQYPAPGSPSWAQKVAAMVAEQGGVVGLDSHEWGFDHGTWSVLKPMFPKADIAVLQLSMDGHATSQAHWDMGQKLAQLRDHGVLVIGSGNVTHNLGAMQRQAASHQAFDWVGEFDQWVAAKVDNGLLHGLTRFETEAPHARTAHPSKEHFLPLLYAAAAVLPGDRCEYFNVSNQAASISMRSMIWSV